MLKKNCNKADIAVFNQEKKVSLEAIHLKDKSLIALL